MIVPQNATSGRAAHLIKCSGFVFKLLRQTRCVGQALMPTFLEDIKIHSRT
jgi:hypothetical protein